MTYTGNVLREARALKTYNRYQQLLEWDDIVFIAAAGNSGVVAVKADGTIETNQNRWRRETDQWLLFD